MLGWVASLPMYDLPEIRKMTDGLWSVIAEHCRMAGLGDVPGVLIHNRPVRDLWSDPNLLFSQCCGHDVVHRYRRELCVLGTPVYAAPGCCDSDYASVVIVPENSPHYDVLDMPGCVAVINGPDSQSGAHSLFGLVASQQPHKRFFSRIIASGSHVASLDMIRGKQADVAAIDCVVFALLQRYRPSALADTRVLGLTYSAPAPPFVTRASLPDEQIEKLRSALLSVFRDPKFKVLAEGLFLTGVADHSQADYRRINREFESTG